MSARRMPYTRVYLIFRLFIYVDIKEANCFLLLCISVNTIFYIVVYQQNAPVE